MIKIDKDIMIVLGNGFSIDFINIIGKSEKINLSNLFVNGDKVPWPENDEPGFLSQFRCPALWELGARPNITSQKAAKIIEDIITCANVSAYSEHPAINGESSNVYIRAYHELVSYLRYLFVYYDQMIDETDLQNSIDSKWGWSELFSHINFNSHIRNVTIITYNYDIILERLLMKLGINFQIVGLEKSKQKFRVIKPHGSISFRSKKEYDKNAFSIKYNRDSLGGSINDLIVDYDVDFDKISNINTMIPPAGESGRYKLVWSKTLRTEAVEAAKSLKEDDDIIYGGVSYGNVDRQEIDEQITALNLDINFKIVNPDVENTYNAVISSLFKQYIHYTSSEVLGGLYI